MWITTSMRETAGGRGSEQEPPPPTGVVGSGSSSGGGEPGAPGVGRGVGWGAAPMGAIGMSGASVAEGRVGSSSRIVWQAATPEAATTIARRAGVTVIRSSLDMADPKVTHGPAPVKARSVDHEAAAKPAVSAGLNKPFVYAKERNWLSGWFSQPFSMTHALWLTNQVGPGRPVSSASP